MADRSSSLFLYASEDKADDDHKFSIAAAQAAITFAAPSAGEQDFKADFKSYQFRKADDSYFNLETRFGAIEGDQASANNAAAITALQADLAMEQNARVSGDGALTLSVNAEVTARIAAVAACQADVDQNEADADAAFAVVAGTVTQEIADRVSAVSAETTARAAAVASLQSQITNILSDAVYAKCLAQRQHFIQDKGLARVEIIVHVSAVARGRPHRESEVFPNIADPIVGVTVADSNM